MDLNANIKGKINIVRGNKKNLRFLLDLWNGKYNVPILYERINEYSPKMQEDIKKALNLLCQKGEKFSYLFDEIRVKDGKIIYSNSCDYGTTVARIIECNLGIYSSVQNKESNWFFYRNCYDY